jgi:hypothetical protein
MAYQVRMYRLPLVKNGRMEDERMTTGIATHVSSRAPRWFTTVMVLLALIGLFNVFASINDFIATNTAGLPSDHTGTFAKLSGTTWSNFKGAQSGAASDVTLLERGYALHELTFAILFLAILAIPFRSHQRWAWWACWALLIAYLGYTLTFGTHDSTILPRSLIGAIGLPILLVVSVPAFFRHPERAAVSPSGDAI